MDRYGVLVFHDQSMTPDQQRTMTAQLGTLELGFARVVRNRGQEPPAAPPRTGYAEVADMSNVGDDGKPVERSDRKIVGNMANQLWHSDSSFQKPAAKYSLLLAVRLPSWGGETEFCDLRAAYDGLDSRMKASWTVWRPSTTRFTRASCSGTKTIRKARSRCFPRCCGRSCALIPARDASCCSSESTRAAWPA
jgi:alpha-ketoglutarate-dependent taurine dioxygenase